MPNSDSANIQLINRMLDPEELLIKSDLIQLSSLNDDETRFLQQHWYNADLKRKRKIVSDVLDLSFEHQGLDFSHIFTFWLDDPDNTIRAHAIKGLVEEENPWLTPRLIKLLHQDNSIEVRTAAAEALGKLALLGELEKIPRGKTEELYQGLIQILDKKTESAKVKTAALIAIAPLNLPRVKGLIEEAYHSDIPETKIGAITAMGLNCNRTWLIALIEELHNDDPAFRLAAAEALGELAEEDAVLPLTELVDDEEPKVQEAAIQSMGKIGGEEARQFLDMLANDPRQRIRRSAKAALKEIDFCENPLSTNF